MSFSCWKLCLWSSSLASKTPWRQSDDNACLCVGRSFSLTRAGWDRSRCHPWQLPSVGPFLPEQAKRATLPPAHKGYGAEGVSIISSGPLAEVPKCQTLVPRFYLWSVRGQKGRRPCQKNRRAKGEASLGLVFDCSNVWYENCPAPFNQRSETKGLCVSFW